MNHVFILALMGLTSVARAESTFVYQTEIVRQGLSCEQEVKAIVMQMKVLPGISIVTSSCDESISLSDRNQKYVVDSLSVKYVAEAELRPYVAIFGNGLFIGTPSDSLGAFASLVDCMSQVPAQKKIFENETGLIAVSSSCIRAKYDSSLPFAIKIEGFGAPDKYLFAWGVDEDSALAHSDVTSLAEKVAQSKDADVAFTNASRMFYYDSQILKLELQEVSLFELKSHCEDQLGEALNIFSAGGWQYLKAFCSSDSSGSSLVIFGLDSYGHVFDNLGYASRNYSSFESCLSNEEVVVQNHRARGETALGAICEGEPFTGKIVMHVFTSSSF